YARPRTLSSSTTSLDIVDSFDGSRDGPRLADLALAFRRRCSKSSASSTVMK
ncbi:unnamed protein product, partial [Haemonchus placei]|uniref:Uncharacterized protein n=1 Tax=Haemonchus placei TaxID=6290 RepID=A0A0N4X1X4_HAEPC